MKLTNKLEGTEKLRELTIHISLRSETDEFFSSTKLNKLLFFSDFNAYIDFGKSITGQEYQKLEFGPAPKIMLPLLRDMDGRDIVIVDRSFHGYPQKKPIAKREPDLSIFSAREIALVDAYIQRGWDKSAGAMSDASHRLPCWKLAKVGETIPYSAGLLNARELTDSEEAYAATIDLSGVAELLAR